MNSSSILLISLESLVWSQAKHLSYCAQLGLEEGLAAHGVNVVTIPSLWSRRAKDLIGRQSFDQIWVELVHTNLSDDFFKWLTTLAPIRVGFLLESAEYSPEEHQRHPFLNGRINLIKSHLKFITHLVACDEHDAENFQKVVPSFWWPQAVPQRFIADSFRSSPSQQAIFCGAIYGERKAWFKNPELQDILVKQRSSEDQTSYPRQFNTLNFKHYLFMKTPLPFSLTQFTKYMDSLRVIRRKCFALWLESMGKGCAVVNLPHLVKTYAGRVVEAMAAGVPVISWEIPDRPRNKALFTDGTEILLFSKNNPVQLIDDIKKIIADPPFAESLARNAHKKILERHTIEKRVEQILKWIYKGEYPQHYD